MLTVRMVVMMLLMLMRRVFMWRAHVQELVQLGMLLCRSVHSLNVILDRHGCICGPVCAVGPLHNVLDACADGLQVRLTQRPFFTFGLVSGTGQVVDVDAH